MKFSLITLFPESVLGYVRSSMLARAQAAGLVEIEILNPREYSVDKHKKVDDTPYGGGPGMVLSVQPIIAAWEKAVGDRKKEGKKVKTIILSPQGVPFTNTLAKKWAKQYDQIVLIAGHYEGVDDRVRVITKGQEVSVGDYVLTGGELPALSIIDAVSRQVSGVLGNTESLEEKRISSAKSYTRPAEFEYSGKKYAVPKVLLSGDHKKIDEWRSERDSLTKE